MSLENARESSSEAPDEIIYVPHRNPKKSYTRDFLLSFSDLEVCKKLPSGIDAAVFSELEEAFSGTLERPRLTGSSLFSNTGRGVEYGSLPSRLENSVAYSRGSSGRWDTRSSGSSDKDGDLQSERELPTLDFGRRFGNQSRRSLQSTEHDGLLGSGAFPKPSGYVGASAPKGRGNGQYQLNRSNEPYQPPRSYKASPFSRRDNFDAVNDETFGSDDFSTQDRAEEERKRRESFELMRKAHQKAFHEKQEYKRIEKDSGIVSLFEIAEGQNQTTSGNKSQELVNVSNSHYDSSKSSSVQVSVSRPLVPPGFGGALLEKTTPLQCPDGIAPKVDVVVSDDNDSSYHPDISKEEGAKIVQHSAGFENINSCRFNLHKLHRVQQIGILSNSSEIMDLKPESVQVSTSSSASILEKLLGSSVSATVDSSFNIMPQDYKRDGSTSNTEGTETSRFAHLFLGEESKPAEGAASMDLLSLISREDVPLSVSETFSDNYNVLQSNFPTKFVASSFSNGISDSYNQNQSERKDLSSGVLTCEDLEQFILSEVEENGAGIHQSYQVLSFVPDSKKNERKGVVDDMASQHLLSLLQKGAALEDSNVTVPAISDARLPTSDSFSLKNSEKNQNSEQTLTLETLFGAAFMSELQSINSPLSVQRGSIEENINANLPRPLGELMPTEDERSFSPSAIGEYGSSNIFHGSNLRTEHNYDPQELKQTGTHRPWSGSELPLSEVKFGDLGLPKRAAEIHLPEEDSLIALSDVLNSNPVGLFRNAGNAEPIKVIPEESQDSILLSVLRNSERVGVAARPFDQSINRRSHDKVEPNNIHHQTHNTPLQFAHPADHTRFFPRLDLHINRNPRHNFVGPDAVHSDSRHPLAREAFVHDFSGMNGPPFDVHQPLFYQMSNPGNLSQNHPLHSFPRRPPPSHSMNQFVGFPTGVSHMHNFPVNHRPPLYRGHGMGMQGPIIGGASNANPEALERLIQMEMRANSNQTLPTTSGFSPGFPTSDFDTLFRFR